MEIFIICIYGFFPPLLSVVQKLNGLIFILDIYN